MTNWTSTDPMTGAVVWQGEDADVDAAVAAARAAQPGWALRPLALRIAVVQRFAEVVAANAEEFAATIARETGKPLWEARTEVGTVAAKVAISITAQAERAGERHSEAGGIGQALRHKPHGVLAVLGPYNFPAHLPNGHIVPALLAGNAVVFKPSELTPASGAFMARLWQEAGLPEGLMVLAQGRANTGRAHAANPGLDGLLFNGSSNTGLAPYQAISDAQGGNHGLSNGSEKLMIAWKFS